MATTLRRAPLTISTMRLAGCQRNCLESHPRVGADLECRRGARKSAPDSRKAKCHVTRSAGHAPGARVCCPSCCGWVQTDMPNLRRSSPDQGRRCDWVRPRRRDRPHSEVPAARSQRRPMPRDDSTSGASLRARSQLTATLPGFAPARQDRATHRGSEVGCFIDAHGRDPGADRRHGGEDRARPMSQTTRWRCASCRAATRRGCRITRSSTSPSRAPGVTFSQNTGLAQITIRGIGTNAVFAPDPIRVRRSISMASTWHGRPWCSPTSWTSIGSKCFAALKGRSYGRNTLGGAINLVSKDAYQRLEASVRCRRRIEARFVPRARVSGPIMSWTGDGQRHRSCGCPRRRRTGPQSS